MTDEKFKLTHLQIKSDLQIKVSVVLLTYNHEKFILQAINSILMQETNFNFEILIAEDFSTDNTRNIVIELQKKYPDKIGVLLPDRNLNSNKYFIQALEMTRGEYIALIDGDDFWTSPQKLQMQADFLDSHSDCSICFHNAKIVYEDGSREPHCYNAQDQKEISVIDDLWVRNFIATCSVMFRKKLVAEIPEWYYSVQFGDWELHIINARHGKIGYINKVMGTYRIHKGGFWSGRNEKEMLESYIKFYKTMNPKFNFKYNRVIKPLLSDQYYFLACNYEKAGNLKEAKKSLKKYFSVCPIFNCLQNDKPFKMLLRLYNPRVYNFIKFSG